jgi:hypothetical protein
MHYLLRNLFVFGILASLLLIYATEAASILLESDQETADNDKCSLKGAVCDSGARCCNQCRVNWGGAWCT